MQEWMELVEYKNCWEGPRPRSIRVIIFNYTTDDNSGFFFLAEHKIKVYTRQKKSEWSHEVIKVTGSLCSLVGGRWGSLSHLRTSTLQREGPGATVVVIWCFHRLPLGQGDNLTGGKYLELHISCLDENWNSLWKNKKRMMAAFRLPAVGAASNIAWCLVNQGQTLHLLTYCRVTAIQGLRELHHQALTEAVVSASMLSVTESCQQLMQTSIHGWDNIQGWRHLLLRPMEF